MIVVVVGVEFVRMQVVSITSNFRSMYNGFYHLKCWNSSKGIISCWLCFNIEYTSITNATCCYQGMCWNKCILMGNVLCNNNYGLKEFWWMYKVNVCALFRNERDK